MKRHRRKTRKEILIDWIKDIALALVWVAVIYGFFFWAVISGVWERGYL
jgi:signal peptidase I